MWQLKGFMQQIDNSTRSCLDLEATWGWPKSLQNFLNLNERLTLVQIGRTTLYYHAVDNWRELKAYTIPRYFIFLGVVLFITYKN